MILERDEETAEFALDEVDLDEDTKKSLFVYEAMRKAHDPLTNTIQDVQIDLSDLKLAPNFYKYCRETVGSKVKMPFARQLWLAYRFFGEYCIAGDTKLFTEHGLVPIEFLESRLGLHPHASVVSTLKGNWPTSHAGMTKRKAECVRVIAAGHGITCTPNHKMLVWNSDARLVWKQAQRLTPTDYLVTPIGMNLWPATSASTTTGPVTPELARFIGYTITNGSFSKRTASPRYPDKLYYYVEFCTPDESIAKDWAHCVKQLFGLSPRLVCKTPRTGKLPVFSSSFCSLAAGTWLEENGFLPGDCYTKKVPQFILSSTKELVIEFVRACFDCDGYIQKGRVGITLANPGVVHDLALLLQNLGVYGVKKLSLFDSANNKAIKIPRERNDFRNRRASWEAKGEYATLFCALVGTLNSSRREVCSSNINSRIKSPRFCSVRRNARPGQLPNTQSLYNRLHGLYPRETYHDSQFRRRLGHLRRSNSCQLDSLDLDFIHELSPQEAHSLSYLKEVKYAFRKVERVSPAGYHDVYDLTVPKNSSFVANGLVVHNCPRCSDPAYNDITHIEVDAEPEEVLEHVVLLNNGRCPSCGARKSQLILDNEMCDYNELVMVLGQRSGKSTLASMMSSYQVHRYLKVPRLSTLCGGIQDFTPVQGTFVGLTFARAIKNLWSPFSSIIERSEWFQQYHAALTHYGNQMGKELFRQSTQFLRYNHLNLEYYPSGPLKRTLRGDTRSLAAIDELGWFPFDLTKEEEQLDTEEDERERANADEVHVSLSNSLATLRTEMWGLYKRGIDHIPTALMLNMSSPSSWKDKICRLLKEADGSRFMLGLRMPTWEINPIYSKDHPLIAEMYRKNPIKADRDFGANPPSLSSSIYSKNTVQRLFSGRHHHVLAPELVDSVIDGEERRIYGKAVTKYERASWPSGILALDAGSVNNSFSMVHAFMEGSVLVVASVMEVIPTGGRKVDFRQLMKHCLYVLISQCNIHCVVADRWNSILLLQDVEKEFPKCMTQQYTLKAKDFSTFNSDFIETGNLVLPSLELPVEQIETVRNYKQELNGYPASHLYLQFLTVRELQGIVTKGDGYTDDIYRALVLAASRIRDKKIAEHLVSFAPRERRMGDFSSKIIIAGRSGLNITPTTHLHH